MTVETLAKPQTTLDQGAAFLLLESLDARLSKLEESEHKSVLKRFTDNAGAVALFLGLLLSFLSLRDVLFTKPEADRIASLTQFNKAVSTAAQIRQELVQMQVQVKDPAVLMAVQSAATPRIMNEVSTARAILPDLKDADVGIPQLLTLIFEASNAGDPAAMEFVRRAVAKTDAPPLLRSEAKRYEARYLFMTGKADDGRKSIAEAVTLIPATPFSAPARAWVLSDWISMEYFAGDCAIVEQKLREFAQLLRNPGVSIDQRTQMTAGLAIQFRQYAGQHCPMPQQFESLLH